MTKDQKKLLARHAEHFQQMASYVRECAPEELTDLAEACEAAGTSNCGWDTYRAAQFLREEIQLHRNMLARRAEIAARWSVRELVSTKAGTDGHANRPTGTLPDVGARHIW